MSMMGMAIAYGAAALIKAGSAYAGGQAAAGAQYRNAENAWNTALWNAQSTLNRGMFQTAIIGNAGRTSAMQQMLVTQLNVNDLKKVAEFNMDLQKQATEYNTALLMDEIPKLMQQRDLSILHIQQEGARKEGSIVAYQGASGTLVSSGSNQDVLIDSRTQQLIDEQVVMLQHQWNVDAVMDAIAKSEWEGQMAIDKMAFDANQQMKTMTNQAAIAAFSILSDSTMQMFSEMNNTYHNYQSILWQGASQAATYESAGQAEATKGAIKAGSSLLSSALTYGSSMFAGGLTSEMPSFSSGIMSNIASEKGSVFEALSNYQAPNLMNLGGGVPLTASNPFSLTESMLRTF